MEQATTKEETERLTKKVFDLVDTDQSGFIEKQEFIAMYKQVFPDVTDEILKKISRAAMTITDQDGDGLVSWPEFLNFALLHLERK